MPEPFPVILCTLGTTTDDPAVLTALIAAGMGLARVNTAYATLAELGERIDGLRRAGAVPVMLDLKGSQLRVDCTTDKADPASGQRVTVPCRYPIAAGDLICVGFGAGPVRFNHDFAADLQVGDLVTFENGTIRTRVADPATAGVTPAPRSVLLEVLDAGAGRMSPQMGANVPGKVLRVPRLSPRDRAALELGVARRVEWYALSFTREAEDVRYLDRALGERGERDAGLVVKIEEPSGIAHLDAIVAAARAAGRRVAVMIARGDLFVELPRVRLPAVQAELIRACARLAVPSIVATGLLLSMQHGPVPARSEVCDVAAAVLAGADSLMLSDETANGVNPALAAQTLAAIVREYRGRP